MPYDEEALRKMDEATDARMNAEYEYYNRIDNLSEELIYTQQNLNQLKQRIEIYNNLQKELEHTLLSSK